MDLTDRQWLQAVKLLHWCLLLRAALPNCDIGSSVRRRSSGPAVYPTVRQATTRPGNIHLAGACHRRFVPVYANAAELS